MLVLNDQTSDLDLLAFLYEGFSLCGCEDLSSVIETIIKTLSWAQEPTDKRLKYTSLFKNYGVFYIIAGILDNLDLIEHGIAIRFPWITERGKALLSLLESRDVNKIEGATGEAYNGINY